MRKSLPISMVVSMTDSDGQPLPLNADSPVGLYLDPHDEKLTYGAAPNTPAAAWMNTPRAPAIVAALGYRMATEKEFMDFKSKYAAWHFDSNRPLSVLDSRHMKKAR